MSDKTPELNIDWLRSIGLEGDRTELQQLAAALTGELELRVGYAIADKLSDGQLDEFERLMDESDETDSERIRLNWLEQALPEYQSIVKTETGQLQADVLRSSDPAAFIHNL